MKKFVIYFICFVTFHSYAQEEVYYIGAGNTQGVTVTSSFSSYNTDPNNVVDGSGMDAMYMEASRLLAQTTIGYTEDNVQEVIDLGIEEWIDYQMALPTTNLSDVLYPIFEKFKENFYEYNGEDVILDSGQEFELTYPRNIIFNYSWWDVNMNNEDQLRHRIALALSEIFVISQNSELYNFADGLSNYYDMLSSHAFGNFRDLIFDVTMHPSMGFYLSHLNNPKTNEAAKIFPDENYAREIMQLFTVGLYELNLDGSRKKDSNGNYIPTYDQSDIQGLAKVFTGLGCSAFRPEFFDYLEENNIEVPEVGFGYDIGALSQEHPMAMYDEWHEPGEKHLLRGQVIPAGQTGMEDINDALDILFNHENVGPFIGRKLIQRLVKSNPSPMYIQRVSKVFANNGQGVRGDLKAVVKAILMDEEARSCEWQQDPDSGMLREPLLRQTQIIRSLDKFNNVLGYFAAPYHSQATIKQVPLFSPTVFNFFLPDYQPVGDLANRGLFAPEFQLHDTHTSIGYINMTHQMTYWETLTWSNEFYEQEWDLRRVRPDFSRLEEFTDFEGLINHLDRFYCHGRLSDNTRRIIREAIWPLKNWPPMYRDHIKTALHLVLISPDYAILK